MARRDNSNERGNRGGQDVNRYRDEPRNLESDDRPLFETSVRALSVLDELLQMTPPSDSRYQYLLLLRHQLEVDERQMQEAGKTLAEFEEAYDKLTAPANRIATYLADLEEEEGAALISLGDGEFIANIDPKIDRTVPIEPGRPDSRQ